MAYRYEIHKGLIKIKTKFYYLRISALCIMLSIGGLTVGLIGAANANTASWELVAPNQITFNCSSLDYQHTLDTISNNGGNFSGTGHYNADNTYTWNIGGNITNNNITFQIIYTQSNTGYTLNGVGTIASDGSINGTVDNNCSTFSMPAGTAVQTEVGQGRIATGGVNLFTTGANQHLSFEAHDYGASIFDKGNANYTNFSAGLNYNANLTCVNVVDSNTALFAYQVPPGNSVSGYWIVWKVTDNGSPGKNHDTAGFTFSSNPSDGAAINGLCESGTLTPGYPQTVTAGNLVVHKF